MKKEHGILFGIAAIGIAAVVTLGCRFTDPHGIVMVSIPAGTFTMGSPVGEANRDHDEAQYSVTLSAFMMGKYAITQVQWHDVMGNDPSNFIGDDQRPVEMVSWYDAIAFCNKLSIMSGLEPVYSVRGVTDWVNLAYASIPTRTNTDWDAAVMDRSKSGYRLPTEAEWEYACRAGTTTAWYTGNTEDAALQNAAWYDVNASNTTHPVGTKAPNSFGLYDMSGNVWEWCWDWYGAYSAGAQTDPTGAVSGAIRVSRGGSWIDLGQYLRSADRYVSSPSSRNSSIGFRLVRPQF